MVIPPYLVKSFFLENQGFFQYIINKYLRRRSHRNGHFSVSGTKIADFRYTKQNVFLFVLHGLVYTHPSTAANLPCLPGSSALWSRVLTSLVPPVHNQGVSSAPLQGHALWNIFLPTTGSFFVCFITDFLPSCNSTFSGRFPIAFRFLYFQLPWLVSAFKHSLLKCSNQPRYTAS